MRELTETVKAEVKKRTLKKTKVATSEKEYEEMLMQMIKDEFGIED